MPNIGRDGRKPRVHLIAWEQHDWMCHEWHDGDDEPPRSIDCWRQVVQELLRVDDPAWAKLQRLARYDRRGFMAANSIIGKLLKKNNDNIVIKNPSAFVWIAIDAAWEDLNEE